MTLNQIRDLTQRSSSPTLRQLLELQRDTWKYRRAEAERGQKVAEAAPGSEEALRQLLDRGRAGNLGDDGKVYGFSEASATADKYALV